MKRTILSLLVALIGVTGAWAQNNVIRYTATEDLGNTIQTLGTITSSVYDPNTHEGVVTFTTDITAIPQFAFRNITSLLSIDLPASIILIGQFAFSGCTSLSSISIPGQVTTFGFNPFELCTALRTVTINSQQTLDAVGYYVEDGTRKGTGNAGQTFGEQVTEFILRGNISSIPANKFYNYCITKVALPIGITLIAEGVFDSSFLQSVTIPRTITSIGFIAFRNCPLQSIIVLATTPPSLNNSFIGVDTSIPVYVPAGAAHAYRTAKGWDAFTNFVEVLPHSLTLVSANTSLGKVYGGGVYEYGTEQIIYAIPEADSKFTGWSDGNTENPRQYVVTSDATLTANFEAENVFEDPAGTGMRMVVTKKAEGTNPAKVYEFDTRDIESVEYREVTE